MIMTAYDKLKSSDTLDAISGDYFYQLIKEFQTVYLEDRQYEESLQLHRNPIELKNEMFRELCTYYTQIQGREEMKDFDREKNALGYVPTRVIEIWKSDNRLRSLYNATKKYCELTAKNFTIISVHIAECRAINKLISKVQRSIYREKSAIQTSQIKKENFIKRVRVKIPNKVKAELQKEIGSKCPFCENSDVGHFEIHHIDETPSNSEPTNLIMLCPICHSKISKGDILKTEVVNKKNEFINKEVSSKGDGKKIINFNSSVNNAIVGNNNVIKITQTRKLTKQKYPPDCIGFDTEKANYISHLITRYNEYKEYEVGKGNVKYAVFASHLKKQFKIGATRTIYNMPIEKFDGLVQYIQLRIDGTKLAKIKGKSHKNYSTFAEYRIISTLK
jgi:5-methylcytosine-specific restriction endonuclease McrA